MIIKKLAVPLINEKILLQTEQCHIATTGITEAAFEFIKNRMPLKARIEIVTGLDTLTDPSVLRNILKHYQDRISLHIYTRNAFNANAYIFDLPYRKYVAFIGSGALSMSGLKDQEEIFFKITDPKQIESLKSWYTGYYEFAEPLTEDLVREFEYFYPLMKERETASRTEKQYIFSTTTAGFSWEAIRFKSQYFKKEDFLSLNPRQPDNDPAQTVRDKLVQLENVISKQMALSDTLRNLQFKAINTVKASPSSRIRYLILRYGETELSNSPSFEIVLQPRDVGVWLTIGRRNENEAVRISFQTKMKDEDYRKLFFDKVRMLEADKFGGSFWIQVGSERKSVDVLTASETLWEFVKQDSHQYCNFVIGRNYSPGDLAISEMKITETILKDFQQLLPVHKLIVG